ncbi:glycosyltransferase family 1 protein [Cucurbitaria berberidis CBS 394.84]|uniref:UDP-N-acetylglucosamine transferase subunit ALG13 n=1 Tax=Cucurbitaria berberidis CBS 394.84 TaxID=1168544 RepID=A0A9P4GH14_9PLEO|nr:glycosyltransferase family 1 protein [Cucurbitaria berberidis CBS 394.84]KAF1845202.1 glycosyltransferase family 1 protein [Cucurbitaria berberidis CBS 394.84]
MAESWNWTRDSKLCFVTTGATAPFTALIESVLSPSSIQTLRKCGFTHLLVQYGSAKDVYDICSSAARLHIQDNKQDGEIIIDGMDFNSEGLQSQFKLVQKSKGLVISHAGSGSVLEALRYQIPLIVVPNIGLLDNHQEELAVAMERNQYLLRGDVQDLASAIRKSEGFRIKMSQFPPVTSGEHRETKSFAAIMDETMGFMD